MSRKTSLYHSTILALVFLAWLPGGEAVAQNPAGTEVAQRAAKWFVLRQVKTGYCRTALLITVGGDYRHQSGLKAAGPYGTEQEARGQKEILESKGICRKT